MRQKMKTINKTQFKLIYFMYNENEYHKVITNNSIAEQAAKLAESMPELFIFTRKSYREAWFSISTFADVLPLIKYNAKYEKEVCK